MGLDRFNKTPCGFCFVEYYTHQDALDCLKYIGGTKLDERIIRADLDPGFEEGRQYGYALDLECDRYPRAFLRQKYKLTYDLDVASLEVKSVTSTVMNTTLAAVVMAVRMTSSVNGRRMSTAPAGRWSFLTKYSASLVLENGALFKGVTC